MDTLTMDISDFARQLGIETCLEFDPELLVPEQWIRDLCLENKCGNYGKHYMCPPYVGSLEESKEQLGMFRHGVLLQYSKTLDARNDHEGLRQSRVEFHNKILEMEEYFRNEGITHLWALMGGSCALCNVCIDEPGEPCPHPDKARTSLEAMAIDVLALLDKFGLDNNFHIDKVTWTGCILY